jgi:RHS repeat-associated protein
VRKDLASGTDVDYYYGGWQILEERRAADGAVLRQHVDSPNYIDEHLELTSYADSQGAPQGSVQARRYYLQNTLFSVYALTDDGQTSAGVRILEAHEYDPYGKHTLLTDGDSDGRVNFDPTDTRTAAGASAMGNPYTFTGREFDPESGLHQYRNRYYNQDRFISRDPIGYGAGINGYEYTSAAPMNYLDPLGLWKISRNGDETAEACADESGSTVHELSEITRFNSNEYLNWLSDAGNGIKQKYQVGEKVKIPNTIYAVWNGEVGLLGRISTNWKGALSKYSKEGYSVKQHIGATSAVVIDSLGALWDKKHIAGWMYYGHGSMSDLNILTNGIGRPRIGNIRLYSNRYWGFIAEYYKNENNKYDWSAAEKYASMKMDALNIAMGGDWKTASLATSDGNIHDYIVKQKAKYRLPILKIYACEAGMPGSGFPDITTGFDTYLDNDGMYIPILEFPLGSGFVHKRAY